MNLTFFHWGIHGWIVYVVVGLLLAFVCYRQGLPMTVRSCFYPLIGDKVYGWMGDVIDILSICGTMFGVCTSLGLGAIQLNAGNRRDWEAESCQQLIVTKIRPIFLFSMYVHYRKMRLRRSNFHLFYPSTSIIKYPSTAVVFHWKDC